MKSNPTELETHNYEKIEANLNVIGYHEASAKIIGQAKNVDDVLAILLEMISKTEEQKELDAFWVRVKNTVSRLLGELGL